MKMSQDEMLFTEDEGRRQDTPQQSAHDPEAFQQAKHCLEDAHRKHWELEALRAEKRRQRQEEAAEPEMQKEAQSIELKRLEIVEAQRKRIDIKERKRKELEDADRLCRAAAENERRRKETDMMEQQRKAAAVAAMGVTRRRETEQRNREEEVDRRRKQPEIERGRMVKTFQQELVEQEADRRRAQVDGGKMLAEQKLPKQGAQRQHLQDEEDERMRRDLEVGRQRPVQADERQRRQNEEEDHRLAERQLQKQETQRKRLLKEEEDERRRRESEVGRQLQEQAAERRRKQIEEEDRKLVERRLQKQAAQRQRLQQEEEEEQERKRKESEVARQLQEQEAERRCKQIEQEDRILAEQSKRTELEADNQHRQQAAERRCTHIEEEDRSIDRKRKVDLEIQHNRKEAEGVAQRGRKAFKDVVRRGPTVPEEVEKASADQSAVLLTSEFVVRNNIEWASEAVLLSLPESLRKSVLVDGPCHGADPSAVLMQRVLAKRSQLVAPGSLSQAPPGTSAAVHTQSFVDKFFMENLVDARARAALIQQPSEIQFKVIRMGKLTGPDPSALLLKRISLLQTQQGPQDAITNFIANSGLDASCEKVMRSLRTDLAQQVIAEGQLFGNRLSAALSGRIRRMRTAAAASQQTAQYMEAASHQLAQYMSGSLPNGSQYVTPQR